jgi:ABC-type bacteriocin/lantibiotic exporter with double-glycine peptidase domain
MDNLKLFSGGASQRRLQEVAEETGLAEWVDTLPMGYQTVVASGGANLSGGQRQLIAITAILASGKKLLLLDEALSNLDWVSRARIVRSRRFEGRTVVYASHEEVLVR